LACSRAVYTTFWKVDGHSIHWRQCIKYRPLRAHISGGEGTTQLPARHRSIYLAHQPRHLGGVSLPNIVNIVLIGVEFMKCRAECQQQRINQRTDIAYSQLSVSCCIQAVYIGNFFSPKQRNSLPQTGGNTMGSRGRQNPLA